ncbi:bifunctional diguanylate cyclase/phosphodiesterase [Neiella marina]|uniref:Bifunctional diguanylate cyclase/phosphodiesterase n=1 Tax=Neiella holothuriorum TaxID=2870530 RepID=A0ABS7EK05_9GAMM|nr:bifunctional diguanylate cyclase/phosphodiesterase [Neiella holothuriorum]MBW8192655.1 bifunctional diguanylate cyclase/phosphodiesterase [Neiella holothuriorum]
MFKNLATSYAVKISLYYLIFGLLWILFSDWLLNALVKNPDLNERLQTFKGWVYVSLTAFLFYVWAKRSLTKIQQLTILDSLTGLKNRHWAINYGQSLASKDARYYLIVVNIDDFKLVNDSEGHANGDAMLVHLTEILQEWAPDPDKVARIGGDEFLIFDTVSDYTELRTSLSLLAVKLRQSRHFISKTMPFSACIGVVCFPDDTNSFKQLLSDADATMSHAKKQGHGQISYYHSFMNEQLKSRVNLIKALHEAVEKREFDIHYQLQVDTQTNKVLGAEALLRWSVMQVPVPPSEFIPLAEEVGLINQINEIVITKAILQLKDAGLLGGTIPKVAINLSPMQFQTSSDAHALLEIASRFASDLPYVRFEMTETAVMENVDEALVILNHLAKLGASLSIDDFGSGHSSLGRLRELPIDEIKIDRSFIRDIPGDPQGEVIVKTIIAMVETMGLDLVAEGVELSSQAAFLIKHGCSVHQGFLYARPVALTELLESEPLMKLLGIGQEKSGNVTPLFRNT